MLKKGSTSSAISSTTAQGYLPPYSGYAAASLSPTVNKNPFSPIRDVAPEKGSPDISDRSDGGVALVPAPEKCGENRPPKAVNSLDDQFKNLSLGAPPNRHDLTPTFDV